MVKTNQCSLLRSLYHGVSGELDMGNGRERGGKRGGESGAFERTEGRMARDFSGGDAEGVGRGLILRLWH